MSSESDDNFLSADEECSDNELDKLDVVPGSGCTKNENKIEKKKDCENSVDKFSSTEAKNVDDCFQPRLLSIQRNIQQQLDENSKRSSEISSFEVGDISKKTQATEDCCFRENLNLMCDHPEYKSQEVEYAGMSLTEIIRNCSLKETSYSEKLCETAHALLVKNAVLTALKELKSGNVKEAALDNELEKEKTKMAILSQTGVEFSNYPKPEIKKTNEKLLALGGVGSDVIHEKEEMLDIKNVDCDSVSRDQINIQAEHKAQLSGSSLHGLHETEEKESSWGVPFSSWSTTLITAASSFSKEMTRGMETVLETMESKIGAPDPALLAKVVVEEERKAKIKGDLILSEEEKNPTPSTQDESVKSETRLNYGFDMGILGTLVSGVSDVFETASNKVLIGGLDTLEKIGKKTMDIIQDGDLGFRRKRAFLKSNNPNLSMVLREARECAIKENEKRNLSEVRGESDTRHGQVSIGLIWDNTEGPVHLEALSLVARQCQDKTFILLQNIPPICLEKLKERIAEIKMLSSLGEGERLGNIHLTLMDVTREVQLPLQFKKIIMGWPSLQESINKMSIEICGLGITNLTSVQMDFYEETANYVALLVGVCHKAAELALITPALDGLKLARQFQKLCSCISGGLEEYADEICEAITKTVPTSDPQINATITNIYVQMEVLNSYLESSLMYLNTIIIQAETKLIADEL